MTTHTWIGGLAVAALLCAAPAAAQSKKAAWSYNGEAERPWAGTLNDSKQLFGQWCSFEMDGCFWMLVFDNKCVKGDRYPVMINGGTTGSIATELACDHPSPDGTGTRYFFTQPDIIGTLVRESSVLGVAVPLKSGEFAVVRFSLTGAVAALDAMLEAVVKRRSSTRDK